MSKIEIVGAGLAGLLAGNLLSRRDLGVSEAQSSLPNNHSAVLRFRSGAIGDAIGIPFRPVMMIKGALGWKNPIADALNYSFKNTGTRRSDRSITQGLVTEQRYIAPANLIELMGAQLMGRIHFQKKCDFAGPGPFISTIPMPDLARLLDYPYQEDVRFYSVSGINVRAIVRNTEAYVSLLVPDPKFPFTRISLTGNELIVEVPGDKAAKEDAIDAAFLLGIPFQDVSDITLHESKYQKILPINERARRFFLHWATDKKGVYSLGRYATARPGLLLDELIKDIRLISGWIDTGHYDMMRQRVTNE